MDKIVENIWYNDIEKLIEESTITEIPDYFVEEEVQNYNNYMNTMSQKFYGMDFLRFLWKGE